MLVIGCASVGDVRVSALGVVYHAPQSPSLSTGYDPWLSIDA